MPKIQEENLPYGASSKFACEPSCIFTYVNKARQIVKIGPGSREFECPIVPNLSKAEVARFISEIGKNMTNETIRVVRATDGVGVFVMTVDKAWRELAPTKVDVATVEGDAHHKRLWVVTRDQADYMAGRDTANHTRPDCSGGCRYFHALEGKYGLDWGVCTEPRSPRAGLLTFEHMGCEYFAQAPDEDVGETPPRKPKK